MEEFGSRGAGGLEDAPPIERQAEATACRGQGNHVRTVKIERLGSGCGGRHDVDRISGVDQRPDLLEVDASVVVRMHRQKNAYLSEFTGGRGGSCRWAHDMPPESRLAGVSGIFDILACSARWFGRIFALPYFKGMAVAQIEIRSLTVSKVFANSIGCAQVSTQGSEGNGGESGATAFSSDLRSEVGFACLVVSSLSWRPLNRVLRALLGGSLRLRPPPTVSPGRGVASLEALRNAEPGLRLASRIARVA